MKLAPLPLAIATLFVSTGCFSVRYDVATHAPGARAIHAHPAPAPHGHASPPPYHTERVAAASAPATHVGTAPAPAAHAATAPAPRIAAVYGPPPPPRSAVAQHDGRARHVPATTAPYRHPSPEGRRAAATPPRHPPLLSAAPRATPATKPARSDRQKRALASGQRTEAQRPAKTKSVKHPPRKANTERTKTRHADRKKKVGKARLAAGSQTAPCKKFVNGRVRHISHCLRTETGAPWPPTEKRASDPRFNKQKPGPVTPYRPAAVARTHRAGTR